MSRLHRSPDLRLGDAIIITLLGVGAINKLPIAQYPDVAPPQVNIRASYPGASAQTLQDSVTQVLEQQLTGLDGLIYFQSSSSSRGQATINVTFEKGTDPDIAGAGPECRPGGRVAPSGRSSSRASVSPSSTDFLLIIGVYDESGRTTDMDVSDWLSSNMQDTIARIPVSATSTCSALPMPCASGSIRPSCAPIADARRHHQRHFSAECRGGGRRGRRPPALPGQMLNATVTASSRFQTPSSFAIIVKAESSGSGAWRRRAVELGAENYNSDRRLNGKPGAGSPSSWRRAPTRWRRRTRSRRGSSNCRRASAWLPLRLRLRHDRLHQAVDRRGGEDAHRGDDPGDHRHVRFLQSWRATLVPAIAIPSC